MGQDVWVLNVEEDPLDPVLRADRIEGAPDLVELPFRQRATKTVVDDLKILLGDLRSFFDPDVRQLPSFEGDGLQLLPLALIVDAPEDDLIPVDQALIFQ